ncbi:MAG: transposase [Nitrosopumilus sp. (ex Thoosa mismalolli)]|nr:transposase [Nitrosopumilus sp. (ex Thoosa mismalolli)]
MLPNELIPKLTNQSFFDDPRIYLKPLPRHDMKFQKITDTQWDAIRKHLPRPARTGRPRADNRRTLDAILYVCVTGTRWIDLPERYGSKSTAHRRLQDWQKAGVWKKILAAAVKAAHNNNSKAQLEAISVDSSSVAAKKGATA